MKKLIQVPDIADIILKVPGVKRVKRLMAESQPGFEDQLSRESRSIAARGASDEGSEGIKAFLEKRAARYP